ncbi:MAG: hypothetical protein RLY20_1104 [Verrucomicrobiota bacterium]
MNVTRLPALILAVAACNGAAFCARADEAPRGRPIEFSTPRSERETNVASASLSRHKTLLDQLEDDFDRPFKSIVPGNSIGGMLNSGPQLVPPPVLPTQRSRNTGKRDLWMTTPDEMLPQTTEDALKPPQLTPDGRRLKDVSPWERTLYKSSDSMRAAAMTNRFGVGVGPGLGARDATGFGAPGVSTLNGVNPAVASSLNALSTAPKQLGQDTDALGSKIRQMQNLRDSQEMFGFGESFKPGKLSSAELQRRETLNKLYNPNYVAPVDGAAPGSGSFATPFGVDSSFYDPPKAAPAVALPGLAAGPAASPVAGYAPPAYVPPPAPIEPTRPKERSSPFMNISRRDF